MSNAVKLRLYIAGDAHNSRTAVANLQDICARFLLTGQKIELVDVLSQPERALDDGVFMTPMLVKLAPLPVCKIVGTLSNTQSVLQALGLPTLSK